MTSLGIMTLSRSPYSELDKMSLFQDLKLKRRKVDSRCSSDGESLADTNASSPDLIVPLSPKMCDHGGSVSSQQLHNQQTHEKNRNSVSPAATLDNDYNSTSTDSTATDARSDTFMQSASPNCVTVTAAKIDDKLAPPSSTQPISMSLADKPSAIVTTASIGNLNLSKNMKLINSTNNNSVFISNHTGGNERRNSNTTNENSNDSNNNTSHSCSSNSGGSSSGISGEALPNTSVIRLVGEERLPSPTKQAFQTQSTAKSVCNSLNTSSAQRILSPHATVLVTPVRIKTEANAHQTNCTNVSVGGSVPPPPMPPATSAATAITSMSDYRKAMPSMQHQTNQAPTVVTIETNNNHSTNSLSNCNNTHNANGNGHTININTKSALQRIETDTNSMANIVNKMQPLSPQKVQIVHTTTAQPTTRCVQMSSTKNSFAHQPPPSQQQQQQQQQQSIAANQDASKHQMPPMKNYIFPVNLHAAITNPNPNRIKRERSPIHAINSQSQSLPMSSVAHSQPSNQSITTVTPVTSTGQMLHPSIQLQHPARDGAILFRVKNDAGQLPCLIQANNQNRIMWNSNTRINGVKPEIIGGPIPLRSPVPNSGHSTVSTTNQNASQQPPRNTPTVIMGESCGVRTMVWGIETSNQAPASHPQTSQSNSINLQSHQQMPLAGPSNNEEAAQLLLSLGQNRTNEMRSLQQQPPIRSQNPLNMERLWAGDYSQLPSGQQIQALNLSSQQQWSNPSQPMKNEQEVPPEDDEQPLVCMICEDKATGLHYGIITCEGCKGFFKRTVQNRRVYTCVADGTCEITKAQRNRCQYCRFKKCIEQGMVLQAVREDRMPGGRNSGAVYNLYKVKYKKHKKSTQKPNNQSAACLQQQQQQQQQHQHQHQQQQQQHHQQHSPSQIQSQQQQQQHQQQHQQQQQQQQHQQQQQQQQQQKLGLICSDTNTMLAAQRINNMKSENVINNIPSHLLNGTILKTALTNPSEIVHLRHRLDNAVSSSKDRSVSYEHAMSMIQTLIDFDAMEDIATLPHFPEFLEDKSEIGDKLCNIGDSIVHKLVSWTKKLPFYLEIPVEIHTKLLTDKWHEILVLTTAAYQALHGKKSPPQIIQNTQHQSQTMPFLEKDDPEYVHEVNTHLLTLQTCLTTLMGHPISMEQLRLDVGHMVEKMTQITIMFRRIKLKMEEYVCLKVYILLNKEVELEGIQERYIQVLRSYLQHTSPNNPGRLGELLAHIPEIQAAASLLLESKMFYVPFVLNSASVR